jgi:hypothetical protein
MVFNLFVVIYAACLVVAVLGLGEWLGSHVLRWWRASRATADPIIYEYIEYLD